MLNGRCGNYQSYHPNWHRPPAIGKDVSILHRTIPINRHGLVVVQNVMLRRLAANFLV